MRSSYRHSTQLPPKLTFNSTGLHLQSARSALRRAQKATQESFAAYTASLETERRVSQEVAALEDRRDHLCKSHHFSFHSTSFSDLSLSLFSPTLTPAATVVSLMLRQNQRPQSAHCPFPGCMCTDGSSSGPDGVTAYPPRKLSTYDSSEPLLRYASHHSAPPPPPLSSSSSGPIPPMRSAYAWDDREREDFGSPQASSSASVSLGGSPARKHARTWDQEVIHPNFFQSKFVFFAD